MRALSLILEPPGRVRTGFGHGRHDEDAVRVVDRVSAGSYLSAGQWLSTLISWREMGPLLDRYATGQAGFHRLEFRGSTTQLLFSVEELERFLLNDLHPPLDVLLRLVGLGADI